MGDSPFAVQTNLSANATVAAVFNVLTNFGHRFNEFQLEFRD